jgi:hypothetical protein
MTLFDVLLIAVGAWIVILIVTAVVNSARHQSEDQRRLGLRKWDGS